MSSEPSDHKALLIHSLIKKNNKGAGYGFMMASSHVPPTPHFLYKKPAVTLAPSQQDNRLHVSIQEQSA